MKTNVFAEVLFFVLFFVNVCCQDKNIDDFYELPAITPIVAGSGVNFDEFGNQMSSTVFRTVSHFECMIPFYNRTRSTLLLYGTKAWTFPIQDINLTLSYPSQNAQKYKEPVHEDKDYLITEFRVILHIDGVEVRGFITRGGIMKDSITLSFVSDNISSLSYQFWLYGKPREKTVELTTGVHFLCN